MVEQVEQLDQVVCLRRKHKKRAGKSGVPPNGSVMRDGLHVNV